MNMPGLPKSTVLLLFAAFAVATTSTAFAEPNRASLKESVPTLSVSGRAELQKPADQLELSIGVVTEHVDATQAMTDNSRAMQRVVDAILAAGLDEDEYETGRFQLTPRYSARPPRDAAPDWTPRIIGYRVINTVQVQTGKLDLAGKIIQQANEAGANTVDNIQFTLADPRKHRSEAISAATDYAQADARALASAAGVELARILSLTLDEDPPIRPVMYERAMMMDAEPGAPPIKPGDVTVRASVNVVYEINTAE
jgi:uncharacterized protein